MSNGGKGESEELGWGVDGVMRGCKDVRKSGTGCTEGLQGCLEKRYRMH